MGLAIATPSAATARGSTRPTSRNNRVDMVSDTWQLSRAGRVRGPEPARRLRRVRHPDGRQPDHRHLRAAADGNPANYREIPGAGLGVVNAFDLNGNFLSRVASPGGVLNAPWGTALARRRTSALFGGDLLIGNFGDGRINAFHENADGTWTNTRLPEGPRRPAAVHQRPVGAPVRQGQRRQRRAQPPVLHRRPVRRDPGRGRAHHPEPEGPTCPAPCRRRCR